MHYNLKEKIMESLLSHALLKSLELAQNTLKYLSMTGKNNILLIEEKPARMGMKKSIRK
jgi:hypothetical protein